MTEPQVKAVLVPAEPTPEMLAASQSSAEAHGELTDAQIDALMPDADGSAEVNKVYVGRGDYEYDEVDAWSRPLVRQVVRAALASNVQPKGTEPVYRRRTDAEALDCANRLNRSFPPSSLKDEAADHIRELVAVVQSPAPVDGAPPLPVPYRIVQDADGFDVQVFRVFQMRDYARAALLAAQAPVPLTDGQCETLVREFKASSPATLPSIASPELWFLRGVRAAERAHWIGASNVPTIRKPERCTIKVWGREIDVVALYRAKGFGTLPPSLTITGEQMRREAQVDSDRAIVRRNDTSNRPIGDREAVIVVDGDEFDALPLATGGFGYTGKPATSSPAVGADDWQHLKQYGYAPGSYMSRCRKCGSTSWEADKRATTCRPCAEALHAERQASESTGATE